MKIYSLFLCILLVGCQSKIVPHATEVKADQSVSPPVPVANSYTSTGVSKVLQCSRDLEALRTLQMSEYSEYQKKYDAVMSLSSKYLKIANDVSTDINDLARPHFQFELVKLCYDIKSRVAQILITQSVNKGVFNG
jgi:hypothetical protein